MYYKHFISVTAQVYFCSSPIRLDSYNRCQFGCTYCFSRQRSAENSARGLKEANTAAFGLRLERVSKSKIFSSLDEFLQRRVPIQLGGLQDPFSPLEESRKVTWRLLSILKDHSYPTIISTKGNLFQLSSYARLLEDMNVYVRISAAGISEKFRSQVDRRCGSFAEILGRIRFLKSIGVPASLRIQPVIPGFEEDSLEMAGQAISAGAAHVSFEYLKLAEESRVGDAASLSAAVGRDIETLMEGMGSRNIGRDYSIGTSYKFDFLSRARLLCSELGAKFGAGDTEFIHLSDGDGCCSGSGYFLKGANQFRGNFAGILSRKANGDFLHFSELLKEWTPQRSVSTYLTTNSRGKDGSGLFSDWLSLLAHRWNGGRSPYSPKFFAGVSWTGKVDGWGFKVYRFDNPVR